DINFEIKKGEFFGIIGRNGSGKSTLLKILAGIYIPDKGKGKITINGKLSPFLELGVGFNPELTGRENIFLGGTILGLSKKQVQEKYDQIVAFSELEEFIDMKLKNYSSGMQVRLAFSLSINVHAEILLMDEVLAVGDTNFQEKCIAEFNHYRDKGKTIVLVSHDVYTIQKYCDRAVLIENGKISKMGLASEVVNYYVESNVRQKLLKKKNANSGDNFHGVLSTGRVVSKSDDTGIVHVGDDISLDITLNKPKTQDPTNIGVGLYTDNGVHLWGSNTLLDSFPVAGKNISLGFKGVNLQPGVYYFNVIVFGKDEAIKSDAITRFAEFEVVDNNRTNKSRGLLDLQYTWEK
ncbi:MAG: ABC transporter ATP-binding protein, partial [Bacillota bacterium]|nr:ABC transporter ATP-binding protein [Bacillota bacterium]